MINRINLTKVSYSFCAAQYQMTHEPVSVRGSGVGDRAEPSRTKTKKQHNRGKNKMYISYILLFMLLLSGDIQLNPGPSANNIGHTVTT